MQAHAPIVVGVMPVGRHPLPVINCAKFRASGDVVSCMLGLSPSVSACLSCDSRIPLVTVAMPAPMSQPRRQMRGLGDLVAACVRVLFLGRADIAERVAARVQALWSRRRNPPSAPGYPGVPVRGCGCKQRQEALNRAIPFGNRHAH